MAWFGVVKCAMVWSCSGTVLWWCSDAVRAAVVNGRKGARRQIWTCAVMRVVNGIMFVKQKRVLDP